MSHAPVVIIHYDPEIDALYVDLAERRDGDVERTIELDPRRLVDYDATGDALGVEFLWASEGLDLAGVPHAEAIRRALEPYALDAPPDVPAPDATLRDSDMAIHPGELLAEELETRSLSQSALARQMGRPVQAINEIIRERKSVTAETAVGLEAALGIDARIWMSLQSQYDIVMARQKAAG
jgi:addiction module HigA family antidote